MAPWWKVACWCISYRMRSWLQLLVLHSPSTAGSHLGTGPKLVKLPYNETCLRVNWGRGQSHSRTRSVQRKGNGAGAGKDTRKKGWSSPCTKLHRLLTGVCITNALSAKNSSPTCRYKNCPILKKVHPKYPRVCVKERSEPPNHCCIHLA